MRCLLVLVLALLALGPVTASHAAFPGQNGKIAFARSDAPQSDVEVYSANPDGSGATNLTNHPAVDASASWSPDGRTVAFVSDRDGNFEIYSMNSDGSGLKRLTTSSASDASPSWSPDGSRIVFDRFVSGVEQNIYVMESDGRGVRRLTDGDPSQPSFDPRWSPNGAKILFSSLRNPFVTCGDEYELFTMNPDGSDQVRLADLPYSAEYSGDWSPDGARIAYTAAVDLEDCSGIASSDIRVINADGTGDVALAAGSDFDGGPAWSPDGSKVGFTSAPLSWSFFTDLVTVNADGSGRTNITNTASVKEGVTDWQPLPYQSAPAPTYDHPKLASPARVSLVPNYRQTISSSQCTARGGLNSTHGAPLALGSCNPPGFTPGTQAHIGPGSSSWASYAVIYGDTNPGNGDQANMTLRASLNDIRTAGGADYNPNASGADLTLVTRLRITDRFNGGSQTDPATVSDFDYQTPIDCTSTAGPEGSNCSLDTSADAITPDTIRENKASVMQLFRFRVNDSGTNGTRGDADDRIFAVQGIYIR